MKIEELLVKHILGISDEEDERALRAWQEEDPAHAAYFRKLRSRRNYRELYHNYCEAHPRPVARRWRQLALRAAALALPVLLSLGWWMGWRSSDSSGEILPGSPKATLYLENGAVVELGNSKELGWIRISDNLMAADENGRLRYEKDDRRNAEGQNVLTTPRGGEYRLTLPDGTHIHLNSLSELRYPLSFDRDKRVVELSGEAYFEVAKDAARPFYVKTNGLTVRQYGTKFSVNARSPQATTVALEEGSVGVCASDGSVQMLEVGQVALWNETTRSVSISEADLDSYTAWHRNRFVFEDKPLGEIMETLSLWYNMDVRFQDADLANLHFTGNVGRYEDINVFLKGVEATVNVQFRIQGCQIRIMRKQ